MIRSVAVVFLVFNFVSVRCILREDPDYWEKLAKDELEMALKVKWNLNTAKNVILFIGDGMGPNTITATRIYKGGESHKLSYETFPHVGFLKTYSANKMVPDSASTATALLCGKKVNHNTVGVDASVQHRDCAASLIEKVKLDCLATLALKSGKSAGFVTTMRVTHATPGPVYAHSAARQWECDAAVPAQNQDCKDIARQLVEDFPGRDLHVIMGGGRQSLMQNVTETPSDPKSSWTCSRRDGRDLMEVYKKDKEARKLKYNILSNNRDLKNLNVADTDYLLGIFANEHLRFESERDKGPDGMPSISDMVEAAIKVLKKNKKGFFLMVEGGNIDMAHHRGRAKQAINESAALDDAVKLAVEMTEENDTLIVVTSDHTHTMTINGYPERGSNIFGTVGPSKYDGINYTVISYGTGGPGSLHQSIVTNDNIARLVRQDPTTVDTDSFLYEQPAGITLDENSHGGGDVAVYARGTVGPSKYDGINYTVISYGTGGPGSLHQSIVTNDNIARLVRQDPTTVDTDSFLYEQTAGITLDENSHGGGDVAVYARGPFSHLFHNVHEQHYVFHAISYAAKIGAYSTADSLRSNFNILFIVMLPFVKQFYIYFI